MKGNRVYAVSTIYPRPSIFPPAKLSFTHSLRFIISPSLFSYFLLFLSCPLNKNLAKINFGMVGDSRQLVVEEYPP